jgi:hypothetical protein
VLPVSIVDVSRGVCENGNFVEIGLVEGLGVAKSTEINQLGLVIDCFLFCSKFFELTVN